MSVNPSRAGVECPPVFVPRHAPGPSFPMDVRSMSTQTHVIFGAGQIGTPLALLLQSQGHHVRLVRRRGAAPAGIDLQLGDARDAAFALRAAHGAHVVYHCMNPGYSARAWSRDLPRLMHGIMDAAAHEGARLVVLDNLYMLGAPRTRPFHEDSPLTPCSVKGEIRAHVSETLQDAMRRGALRACIGRASDFYGPGGRLTHFGDSFWPGVLKGGPGGVVFNPDHEHTYHYTLDVVRALMLLGTANDEVEGRVWMLPCAEAETTRALIGRFGRVLGRDLETQRMADWMQSALGVVMPVLRELREMNYQWEAPFRVDDRQFRARFSFTPTSLAAGAEATVDWAKAHYGKAR